MQQKIQIKLSFILVPKVPLGTHNGKLCFLLNSDGYSKIFRL